MMVKEAPQVNGSFFNLFDNTHKIQGDSGDGIHILL